jgi:hypothetical protein
MREGRIPKNYADFFVDYVESQRNAYTSSPKFLSYLSETLQELY